MSTRQAKKRGNEDPPETKDPKKNRTPADDQGDTTQAGVPTADGIKQTEAQIDARIRPGLEAALYTRLNELNNHVGDRIACASLAKIDLSQLRWGPPAPGRRDRSRYLCQDGNVFTLWSVAEVVAVNIWERDNDGHRMYPRNRQSILFKPMLDADFQVARRIVSELAQPVAVLAEADGVWTGRYMSEWGKPAHVTPLLDKVYDARNRFESKQVMNGYPIENVNSGDLVLLEMTIIRYHKKNKADAASSSSAASTSSAPASPQNTSSPSKGKWQKKPWIEWDVDLRLEACSVLYADPDGKGPQVQEDGFEA
ncbi:hypothetical protein EIP86_003479 [Pleurotus ostreatoroseus]|nr:hypothetical protein EIP86_003479 [Pleurotus ostreatoroseus]